MTRTPLVRRHLELRSCNEAATPSGFEGLPSGGGCGHDEGGLAEEELAVALSDVRLSPPLADLVGGEVSDARAKRSGDLVDP